MFSLTGRRVQNTCLKSRFLSFLFYLFFDCFISVQTFFFIHSNKYRNPGSGFLQDSQSVKGLSSPLRCIAAEPFNQYIAKILRRSVSNPLLM